MPASPAFTVAPPGFRLPPEVRLGVVRLEVADLARSLAWYQSVLGLHVINQSSKTALLGAGADDRVGLVQLNERSGVSPVPSRGRLGLYHYALLLPDRAALGRFLRHLGDIHLRIGMADHLVSEAVYLSDPDGLGIEIYADRARESWRVEGSVIAMASDPLDVDDLLRAGPGPWTGIPAGTRVGHVHLHVGDLDQAGSFYHRALGLDRVVLNFPGALFLSAGGYHHHLGTNTWAAGAPSAREGDARLLEWSILLPKASDVAEAAASLEKEGFEVKREGGAVLAADPWGTTVRLADDG